MDKAASMSQQSNNFIYGGQWCWEPLFHTCQSLLLAKPFKANCRMFYSSYFVCMIALDICVWKMHWDL